MFAKCPSYPETAVKQANVQHHSFSSHFLKEKEEAAGDEAGKCYNNNNNNNNNSLLTLLAVKNWINGAIYNWVVIIKSIYNNEYSEV